MYLKCEYLRCGGWDDIEELLNVFVARREDHKGIEDILSEMRNGKQP